MDNKDENGAISRLGVALNELTDSKHRDPFAGTPQHKFIPAKNYTTLTVNQSIYVSENNKVLIYDMLYHIIFYIRLSPFNFKGL